MNEQFSERLRFVREMRGKSQAQMAKDCSFAPSYVGHIESGRRLPSLPNLRLICKGLLVSADYLLGLSDKPSP